MTRAIPGWLCLLLLFSCGPYVASDGEASPAASPGSAAPGDGGSAAQGSDGTATQDGGGAPAAQEGGSAPAAQDGGSAQAQDGGSAQAQDGGSPPAILSVRDVQVDGVRASVLYAHNLKARDVRCGRLVFVKDSELPSPGEDDYKAKGDLLDAEEIHAHDVDAQWIEVDTLYVRSLKSK